MREKGLAANHRPAEKVADVSFQLLLRASAAAFHTFFVAPAKAGAHAARPYAPI